MKVILIALLFISVSGTHDWSSFKAAFRKTYSSPAEEQQRKENFLSNLERIKEHNARYFNGEETYWMGMNHFGDWSYDELSKRHETSSSTPAIRYESKSLAGRIPVSSNIPDSIDWRDHDAVTPVEQQGSCSCGWAYSAAGAIEGQLAIRLDKKVILSKQNLMDCSQSFGTTGCNGGSPMEAAFSYVQANGIEAEETYPYSGSVGSCSFNSSSSLTSIVGHIAIDSGNEDSLKEAVALVGPVSAGIDDPITLKFYEGGIYTSMFCNTESTNHGVLVTGYGSENGTDFWLIKNSWGREWGESGYFRLARNDGNQCAIATSASYPFV